MTEQPVTITTIRKDRVDRSDLWEEKTITGPTHIELPDGYQTWCGSKIRGFGVTVNRHGSLEDVTCKTCLRAHATNRPRPWKKR